SDLGVHAVLVIATEVDNAVLALVSTTDVTGSDTTLVIAAAGLGQRAQQGLLGRGARDLSEIGNARAATTRGRRLVLTNSHVVPSSLPSYSAAVKMSMVPDFRVTMARLVSLRLPMPNLVRRVFPLRLRVLILSTFTPKTCSMANLISVLLAVGSTSKVY